MFWRVRVLGITFLVGTLLLSGRLFFWQIVKGEELSSQGRLQYQSNLDVPAKRGSILASDESWLAASVDAWLLYATKVHLTEPNDKIADLLSPILVSLDELKEDEELDDKINQEKYRINNLLSQSEINWVPLKRKVPTETKNQILALELAGLGFDHEQQRVYPESSSAAHLLGFVGKDEDGNDKGYFGLEGFYDLTLNPKSGFIKREANASGAPILVGSEKLIQAREGVDIVTHINKSIQFSVEEKLKKSLESYGAKQGTVIVMNPQNGGILAMASTPSYDPKRYVEFGDEFFKNPSISESYEPGSIFKPLIMAAALDAGVIESDTKCDICGQAYKVDKYFIETWDKKYYKDSTMTEVIVHSDNVGMVFAGNKLGIDKTYEYISKYGFGEISGIDIEGEFSPQLREEGTWSIVDLATATFGQGIAVTPIQMVKAMSAIANDGTPVVPQVVDKLKSGDWEQDISPQFEETVLSKEAANEATAMMIEAVKNGEAKWTVPDGRKIAGKTGTAQIAVEGHYDDEKNNCIFYRLCTTHKPSISHASNTKRT